MDQPVERLSMRRPSLLLAITGSEESRYAADLCWSIAEKTHARVTVQHVVDSQSLWELLRSDETGLLGKRPYTAAYLDLSRSLHLLGRHLLDTCRTEADKRGVETEAALDEGNPIEDICRRADAHDLVIIGHRLPSPRRVQAPGTHFVKYAIAEGLVYECPRPLLVVQQQLIPPVTMKILVTLDRPSFPFIKACLKMAELLGMRPELLCVADETPAEESTDNFKQAIHELASAPVPVHIVGEMLTDDAVDFLNNAGGPDASLDPGNTLLVIPTSQCGLDRTTIVGGPPSLFIRHPTPPNIILWPEEYLTIMAERFQSKPVTTTSFADLMDETKSTRV